MRTKSRHYHQGTYKPINEEKYKGDPSNICYRSGWERSALRWCDTNPDVVEYASEEVVIPYIAEDGQRHRYFIDLYIKFNNGKRFLIEIKPKAQTIIPDKKKYKSKRKYEEACRVYMRNRSKWLAAMEVAQNNGLEFHVWTEDTLKKLGIRI